MESEKEREREREREREEKRIGENGADTPVKQETTEPNTEKSENFTKERNA